MLPDDASSMYEAPCLSGPPLMCFPSGKSVVTFLILLDWKNIANMVWSGKSFDAGALQINLQMPYGLHSSLNLFPINVYWIFCGANMCVTRLGKQKAGESSLWQSVIIMICPFFFFFFSPCCMIDELQSRSNTSKQENMQTIPLWVQRFLAHLTFTCQVRHKENSTQKAIKKSWLWASRWLINWQTFPYDVGYWVTTDREVNRQQASSGGGHGSELFQTQQTFLPWLPTQWRYNLLSVRGYTPTNREPNICHQQLPVWVSAS